MDYYGYRAMFDAVDPKAQAELVEKLVELREKGRGDKDLGGNVYARAKAIGRHAFIEGLPIAARAKADVLPMNGTTTEIIAAARAYAVKSFAGKRYKNKSIEDWIVIDRESINHPLSAGMGTFNALVMTVLPDVLEKMVFIAEESDSKNRDQIKRILRFGARIDLGERVAEVGIVVRERSDGKFHYHHYEWKTGRPK